MSVSLVLVKMEAGLQKPVCYVSKSLQEAKIHYLPLEKAILAVVHAMRKLIHYFQVHIVVVLTQLPLQSLLWRFDYTGRIAKWGKILGAFDIKYTSSCRLSGRIYRTLKGRYCRGGGIEGVVGHSGCSP